MRTSTITALWGFVLIAALTGCDTATAPVASSNGPEVADIVASPSSGSVAVEGGESASAARRGSGAFQMWNGRRSAEPGRGFLLYGRRAVWSEGFEFEFRVRRRSGNPNLYLFTFDSNGRHRRTLDVSQRPAGLNEQVGFAASDLEPGDAYVGGYVFAADGQRAEFDLSLWAERTAPAVPSLVYPLDRARRIVNGYEYGDHWEGRECVESGLTNKKLLHAGVDYYAPTFGEDVYAAASGVVRYARADATWGGYIVIEHEQPGVGTFTTAYTHVAPAGISEGSTVTASTRIGTIASGSYGYGAHLDFRVRMQPFSWSTLTWILRGRFPEVSCVAVPGGPREPAFPEHTVDPEGVRWTAR